NHECDHQDGSCGVESRRDRDRHQKHKRHVDHIRPNADARRKLGIKSGDFEVMIERRQEHGIHHKHTDHDVEILGPDSYPTNLELLICGKIQISGQHHVGVQVNICELCCHHDDA